MRPSSDGRATMNKQDKVSCPKDYLQYSLYRDVLAQKRLRLIVEQIQIFSHKTQKSNLKILDLGCGIGGITFPLSYLGHKVTGVDIDPQSIDNCTDRNTFPNATFFTADIANLQLNERFDVIVCSEVLEHSSYPEQLLNTINKHLEPHGIGIITIPHGYSFYEIMFSRLFQKVGITVLFHKLPPKMYRALTGSPSPYHSLNIFCGHVQFFTFKRFAKLLTNCEFRIVNIKNQSLGLFLDWNWLSLLRKAECKLADYVPNSIAGGWVVVVSKKEQL